MPNQKAQTRRIRSTSQDFLRKPYARILVPENDGTYSADVLEFPGCHAYGTTAEEAFQNLEKAAISWIEAALEQGQEIPKPMAIHDYSGKISLRLPRSIHQQAARVAQRDDVSLNHFFISAIAARVGAEEFYEHLAQRFRSQFPVAGVVISTVRNSSTIVVIGEHFGAMHFKRAEAVVAESKFPAIETTEVSANE